jgi:hypothetical protein
MDNIVLRNVQQYGNLLPPGIIRCNETNPCTGFEFDNVNADGWWNSFGYGYISENVYGTVSDSYPEPEFLSGEPTLGEYHAQETASDLVADWTHYVKDQVMELANEILMLILNGKPLADVKLVSAAGQLSQQVRDLDSSVMF